ncbi:MAG: polysaccharide pyruvyl transferase family protein [Treponema sp.]|jgi:colanic acid/amylovoran biosynthesis protein|nr:polysaccharide pyruvyl transferase family protein [Treponema sp.]
MPLSKGKRILVRAYTGKNVGDDLFLKILFERFPYTRFYLLTSNREYETWKEKYANVSLLYEKRPAFIIRCMLRLISFFDKSSFRYKYYQIFYFNFYSGLRKGIDAYLLIGGSLFAQYRRGITIDDRLHEVIVDALYDIPKYILGANFGPFIEPEYIEYYKRVFDKFTDVCFRDYASYSYFKNLRQIRYEKDIVFALNFDKVDAVKRSIGFSVIDLLANRPSRKRRKKHENKYSKIIMELIKYFCDNGYSVYLFSLCKEGGDEQAVKTILTKLPRSMAGGIRTIAYRGDLECFVREYMQMEIMIATRFHAMLLSLLADRSMYAFCYEEKMTHVLQDLNYSGGYSTVENIDDVDGIIQKITNKTYTLPLDAVRKSAAGQFSKFAEFILV